MAGYLIAWIRVTDPARYALYRPQAVNVLERLGGDVLVDHALDGAADGRTGSVLVAAFPSLDEAGEAARSPQFASAAQLLRSACEFDHLVLPGRPPRGRAHLPGAA